MALTTPSAVKVSRYEKSDQSLHASGSILENSCHWIISFAFSFPVGRNPVVTTAEVDSEHHIRHYVRTGADGQVSQTANAKERRTRLVKLGRVT